MLGTEGARWASPYRGWHALHHWLGLWCGLFVLTWLLSGWLSLDDGLLFSKGRPSAAEYATLAGSPAWDALPSDEIRSLSAADREVEWFSIGGRIYRRERTGMDRQALFVAGVKRLPNVPRAFLSAEEIDVAARRLAPSCRTVMVGADDLYAIAPTMPGAPIYRAVCGADWYEIDGSSGVLLEKLDASRRAYRWLYTGLHTLDFPPLANHPQLRAATIVALCGCGLLFSATALIIAWLRVLKCFSPARADH
jgi:hypothetical protein